VTIHTNQAYAKASDTESNAHPPQGADQHKQPVVSRSITVTIHMVRVDAKGGTGRRGGPVPYLRLDLGVKVREGLEVARLVAAGASFRQAAAALDMSRMTAWRRYWFLQDWGLPGYFGRPSGPIPPQRSTRACPRGRPFLPTLDNERE
jgi:hypothetical protein